jgi:hypothetical protein
VGRVKKTTFQNISSVHYCTKHSNDSTSISCNKFNYRLILDAKSQEEGTDIRELPETSELVEFGKIQENFTVPLIASEPQLSVKNR